MNFIKIILFYFLRESLSLISLFLKIKDNRILFTSFNGKQYSCNPKYITEYLLKRNENKYEIIWVLNNKTSLFNSSIKTVKYMSIEYVYYYFTSKMIITNMGFKSIFKKPKHQYRIETWHGGGAYKKADLDIFCNEFIKFRYKTVGKELDYYISSCKAFTKVVSNAQAISENKFLNFGMPRNDIFFYKENVEKANEIVRKKYNLNNDECIILYAPTWRDDSREIINEISELKVLDAFKKMTNKKLKLLIRAHYHTKHYVLDNNCIDVTAYPDMQELLCAADILITDYSSCMWDFSLMYKPCFIYATDIDQYKQDRDFYTPMSEWPFPIATNTDELINNIVNFNEEEYIEKVKKHHQALGSYEDGHACERVCKLIEDIIDGKVQKQ